MVEKIALENYDEKKTVNYETKDGTLWGSIESGDSAEGTAPK